MEQNLSKRIPPASTARNVPCLLPMLLVVLPLLAISQIASGDDDYWSGAEQGFDASETFASQESEASTRDLQSAPEANGVVGDGDRQGVMIAEHLVTPGLEPSTRGSTPQQRKQDDHQVLKFGRNLAFEPLQFELIEGVAPIIDSVLAGADATHQPATSSISPPPLSFWWDDAVRRAAGLVPRMQTVDNVFVASDAETAIPLSLDHLMRMSLTHSPKVQALLAEPEIRYAEIEIQRSAFDWSAFVESEFSDTNDPIGSRLTTGFVNGRYLDQTITGGAGFRRKNQLGGSIEVGQRIGNQRNNSQFLLPNPQGTSRFEFNAKQPLFRGAGRAVNESQIVLARLGANAADGRVQFEMQQHLRDVAIAYWELYEARAQWLQRQRNFQQAEEILQTLLAREQEDASRRQVLRTAVEVKKRMADLARSRANILDAQSRLQLLVRTPLLIDNVTREWTPQDVPFQNHQEIHTQPFVVDAMENRRDISEAMAELRAAQVRVGVSKNALLPRLDLLVSTYAAGLDGGDVIVDALDDQIRRGRPSFSAGFLFDVPLGRHAAKADVRRRNWQLNQAIHRFEQATATAMTETQIAVRDVNTSHAELMALIASVDAANREVAYLEDRFRSLPMPGDSSVLLLENLLSAQQRQLREELAVASSTVSYAIAWVRLRFVTGTLFCDHGKIPHSQISSPAAHDFAVQPVPGGTR